MLLLAEITSNEWLGLVSLLAVAAGGWVAVYVKLNRIDERLGVVVNEQKRIEADGARNWEHVSKHEGRLHTLERYGDRVLDKLQIPRPDRP